MGGDTYHFGVSKITIHLSHLLTGSWLVYIGYKRITDEEISDLQYNLLTILGSILFLYFVAISYKELGKVWNYAFGIPNYLIFITHLTNAILFVLMGLKYLKINKIMSLYLIISGALAAMYHAHLMILH